MDLTHRFTVPTPVDSTWEHFQDIAAVGQCFPGATVTSVDGDSFQGTVKVKLGPIALVYTGTGTFVEKDDSAHRFVVDAKGKDKRGNGTAGAKVTLSMQDSAEGGTDVEVVTDLAITGKPAQFGRGVMQDVSDKLLGQFVNCLEQRLGDSQESAPTDAAPAPAAAGAGTVPTDSGDSAGDSGDAGDASTAAPAAASNGASTASPAAAEAGRHAAPRPVSAVPSGASSSYGSDSSAGSDDALDLGATVLPVLMKGYWKQGAAGLAVVALLVWLIRRR